MKRVREKTINSIRYKWCHLCIKFCAKQFEKKKYKKKTWSDHWSLLSSQNYLIHSEHQWLCNSNIFSICWTTRFWYFYLVFILFYFFCCHLPFADFINLVSIFIIDWAINFIGVVIVFFKQIHSNCQFATYNSKSNKYHWLPSVVKCNRNAFEKWDEKKVLQTIQQHIKRVQMCILPISIRIFHFKSYSTRLLMWNRNTYSQCMYITIQS